MSNLSFEYYSLSTTTMSFNCNCDDNIPFQIQCMFMEKKR